MQLNQIAIILSVFSVLVSALALGWNIYRDVILKPRVRVWFAVVSILSEGSPEAPQYLNLKVTNHGPGSLKISNICVRDASLWKMALRRVKLAIIIPDDRNPMSEKLPSKVEVGDKIEILLPYNKHCFLNGSFTHVGVSDYYGRRHWAPKKQLREAYKAWERDFR